MCLEQGSASHVSVHFRTGGARVKATPRICLKRQPNICQFVTLQAVQGQGVALLLRPCLKDTRNTVRFRRLRPLQDGTVCAQTGAMPRLLKIALACALTAAGYLSSSAALAQPVIEPFQELPNAFRTTPENDQFTISLSECVANSVIVFEVPITNHTDVNNHAFEVWASAGEADCTDVTNRRDLDARCRLLHRGDERDQSVIIPIPVRRILADRLEVDGEAIINEGSADLCELRTEATTQVAMTFLYADAIGETFGTPFTWTQVAIDLTPPAPPADVTVLSGDGSLSAELTPDDGNENDIVFEAYCIPVSTPFSELTGRAIPPGQTLDPIDTNFTCEDAPLVAGSPLPVNEAELGIEQCGTETGGATDSVSIDGVINYQAYAVAITATDAVGNAGVVSNVSCVAPEFTISFGDAFEAAGGTGAGEFCAVATVGSRGHPWLLFGLVGFAALLFQRRRHSQASQARHHKAVGKRTL